MERRRLADDLVGTPRWGRWLVFGVLGLFWIVSGLAVIAVSYMAFRLMGVLGLALAIGLFALLAAYVVALAVSPRFARWARGDDSPIDFKRWPFWSRFG